MNLMTMPKFFLLYFLLTVDIETYFLHWTCNVKINIMMLGFPIVTLSRLQLILHTHITTKIHILKD